MASQQAINNFLVVCGKYFHTHHLRSIQSQLAMADEQRVMSLMGADFHDPTMMLIVSLVGGWAGIDRFLLGDVLYGVCKLLTGGCSGIWWLIDLFLITGTTKDKNYMKFQQLLSY